MDAMREPLSAFWCRIPSRPNFGDALTPWLIRRITGKHPVFVMPEHPRRKYFVTGSIVNLAGPACIVWGAGIMYADDYISPHASLLAVRGPLTRRRALSLGVHCPQVYGDPALLLPRLYRPPVPEASGIGLALHFSDRARLAGTMRLPDGLRLIGMQDPVESVIDQISGCELVVSSSLHGLIVSHAYGIPAVWAEFRPLPSGDGSKFRDYLQSIDCQVTEPLRLQADRLDPAQLRSHKIDPPSAFDLDALWRACPFRRPA